MKAERGATVRHSVVMEGAVVRAAGSELPGGTHLEPASPRKLLRAAT